MKTGKVGDRVRSVQPRATSPRRGFTREAYALDVRQLTAWCGQHDRRLFDARRVDIEYFARDLEDRGRARATVARRLAGDVRLVVDAATATSSAPSSSPQGPHRPGSRARLVARSEWAAGLRRSQRRQRRPRRRAGLAFDSVVTLDAAMLLRALEVYEVDRLDFAEAYLVAAAERNGVGRVASFDPAIDRVATVERVEPGS